jgi:ATP-dependent DNA helicase RecQ
MSSKIATDALIAHERGLALLVIATIVESTPHIGRPPSRGFVVGILTGSSRADLVAADAHRLATFGALADLGADSVHRIVDGLVSRGFVETVRGNKGLYCSALGRSLAEGHVWRPLGVVAGAVDAEELDLATRSGLVDALRRHASNYAATNDIPERLVFPGATLREIATRRPRTEDELANLPGVGPKLLGIHGTEVLRIVAEHAPIIERLRVAVTGATR